MAGLSHGATRGRLIISAGALLAAALAGLFAGLRPSGTWAVTYAMAASFIAAGIYAIRTVVRRTGDALHPYVAVTAYYMLGWAAGAIYLAAVPNTDPRFAVHPKGRPRGAHTWVRLVDVLHSRVRRGLEAAAAVDPPSTKRHSDSSERTSAPAVRDWMVGQSISGGKRALLAHLLFPDRRRLVNFVHHRGARIATDARARHVGHRQSQKAPTRTPGGLPHRACVVPANRRSGTVGRHRPRLPCDGVLRSRPVATTPNRRSILARRRRRVSGGTGLPRPKHGLPAATCRRPA